MPCFHSPWGRVGGKRSVENVALMLPEWAPVSPVKCWLKVRAEIAKLPATPPGEAIVGRDAVRRAWLVARCQACQACLPR